MKRTILAAVLLAVLWCLPAYGQNIYGQSEKEVCTVSKTEESGSTDRVTVERFQEQLKSGGTIPAVKYATARVNIRQEPNTDSVILGTCRADTKFEVIVELNGWSMIAAEGGYVYMKSDWFAEKPVKEKTQQNIYLGNFRITHYCPCRKCNGKWAGGPTESGCMPQINRTIAVDKKQIPLGSQVMINGQVYIAEDTGSGIKSNCIDIFVGSHQEALKLGVYDTDVYLVQ